MAICLEYQAVYSNSRESATSIKFHLMAAVLLLCALIARVTLKIEGTRLGYALAQERTRTVELDMERRELELRRSILLKPDTLTRKAEELGLRALDVTQAKKLKL